MSDVLTFCYVLQILFRSEGGFSIWKLFIGKNLPKYIDFKLLKINLDIIC